MTLPALGESVTEGTVTRWLKSVGDEVAVDEPLLEVSTDKVDTEIPSPVAGKLLEIKVEEDETVEVGAELAIIGDGSASPSPEKREPEPEPEPEPEKEPEPEPEPEEQPEPKQEEAPAARVQPEPSRASPSPATAPASAPAPSDGPPRRAAATSRPWCASSPASTTSTCRQCPARGWADASASRTSSTRPRPRSRLLPPTPRQPPRRPSRPPRPPASRRPRCAARPRRSRRLRKIIAERMVDSLQTGAQLTQVVEVDVTKVARLRDASKADFLAREGVKLSYLPFFAKATVDALKQHPKLNATIDTEAGEITYYDVEHLAFAVDTEKGLLTPVVKDAGDLSIAGLAKKIADVAERTRTNKIGPDELGGGTFTITNLGSVGALWDTPIINKPQVAILGPGSVVKRPVVIDDPDLGETIAVRHMVYLALTYDHRLVDGADAGRFLQDIKKRLEAGVFEI